MKVEPTSFSLNTKICQEEQNLPLVRVMSCNFFLTYFVLHSKENERKS